MEPSFVTVTVHGKARSVVVGTKLADLLEMPMPCGGHGKCGKCKVRAEGALSPVTDTERNHLTQAELHDGIRLACCTSVIGDCTVELPEENKRENQILTQTGNITDAVAPTFAQYGAAIDIGTTTLAAQLYDREGRPLAECGRLNPQSAWGADVISRIEASMKGEGEKMAASVRGAIDEMLVELSRKAKIDAEEIDGLVLTGNTAMLHLLTGTSTEPLSHAPFAAKRLFGEILTPNDLGLTALSLRANIYLPPCIAAFVGADTVCALLATELTKQTKPCLLADIGTNGEMALWHDGILSVCSTAAGPAFEGVGISMGMNGSTGAIDKVSLLNGTIFAHVIGDVAPSGICGSGLIDAVACLLENETLDETGLLDDDPVEISPPVILTQQDVRMVQLAKSAICAGIRTLLREAKQTEDQVFVFDIAGGFGSYLNIGNAGKIGLIPAALTGKVKVVGNAALAGAAMLLLDRDAHRQAEKIAREAKVVDLATNPVFADSFMNGMLFDA